MAPLSDAVKVALIGVISTVMWPVVVIIGIIILHEPIGLALRNAAGEGGATFEFAGVKISLIKGVVPIPPDEIKTILPQLDGEMIEYIAANVGGDNTPEVCYQDAGLREFRPGSLTQEMIRLKLITLEDEDKTEPDGKVCLARGKTRFTKLYNALRAYVVDVIKAISFAHTGSVRQL